MIRADVRRVMENSEAVENIPRKSASFAPINKAEKIRSDEVII